MILTTTSATLLLCRGLHSIYYQVHRLSQDCFNVSKVFGTNNTCSGHGLAHLRLCLIHRLAFTDLFLISSLLSDDDVLSTLYALHILPHPTFSNF